MGTRHCPQCGEEYSDTYKKCPFCEEEEAIRTGRPLKRKGGKRLERRRRGGVGGIMLLMTCVIILLVVGYVFFGNQVQALFGVRTGDDITGTILDNEDNGETGESGEDMQSLDGGETEDGDTGTEGTGEPTGPLALSSDSMTIPTGETARLTTTGGSGGVTWTTSNEHIATVDAGAVTGQAGGTATITAVSGEESVSCLVTVTGDPWVSAANLSLNLTDFTLRSGDPDVTMSVSGTDSSVTWASKDTSIVTISESGVVSRVGPGTTEITATVDGQVLTCTVRCK